MYNQEKLKKQDETKKEAKKLPYASPAIIHESEITTRAGSPTGSGSNPAGYDPADLFGK
ncbi:MAG: hypothetical protein Kow0080_11930 [Candidatus Promineifilaceae bacterium]